MTRMFLGVAALGAMTLGFGTPASAVSSFQTNATPAISVESEVAHQYREYRGGRGDDRYRGDYGRRYAAEPVYQNTRVWQGRDGRYYCRKRNGTTGMIIGGAVGALVGREVDGGHNRALGTILGAAGGALLGREVTRSGSRCR